MTAYRFSDEYKDQFGVRWLLRRLNIFPNAYYNYKKHWKAAYEEKKQYTKEQIKAIYHEHNGVDGYRMMRAYLERKGIVLSALTVHKYMNTELGLMSVTRRKAPEYKKGKPIHFQGICRVLRADEGHAEHEQSRISV